MSIRQNLWANLQNHKTLKLPVLLLLLPFSLTVMLLFKILAVRKRTGWSKAAAVADSVADSLAVHHL
jgi:hypothetical protein